jgi:hypothetical protein
MTWCEPHLERTGARIPAAVIVDNLPMCQACFDGRPIRREIEMSGRSRFHDTERRPGGRIKRLHFVCDRRPGQQPSENRLRAS